MRNGSQIGNEGMVFRLSVRKFNHRVACNKMFKWTGVGGEVGEYMLNIKITNACRLIY